MSVSWIAGCQMLLVVLFGTVFGDPDPIVAAVLATVAVSWLIWVQRPAALVTGTAVDLRRLWSTEVIPIGEVSQFEVATARMPFQRGATSVNLVVRRRDGSVVMFPWVGWTDMISPLLTAGTRPVTVRQQRVLDRLNAALDEHRVS